MHDDDLKRRLQDELDRSVGAPPRLDYSDALMRGRGKRLGLRLTMTFSMVVVGTAIFAGGLGIGRLLSSEPDVDPAPRPDSVLTVDPDEPCAVLDEESMTQAVGFEISGGGETLSRELGDGERIPLCRYFMEGPGRALTVYVETEVTPGEFVREMQEDPENTRILEDVGDAAFIFGKVNVSVRVRDVAVHASVQNYDSSLVRQEFAEHLAAYIAQHLRAARHSEIAERRDQLVQHAHSLLPEDDLVAAIPDGFDLDQIVTNADEYDRKGWVTIGVRLKDGPLPYARAIYYVLDDAISAQRFFEEQRAATQQQWASEQEEGRFLPGRPPQPFSMMNLSVPNLCGVRGPGDLFWCHAVKGEVYLLIQVSASYPEPGQYLAGQEAASELILAFGDHLSSLHVESVQPPQYCDWPDLAVGGVPWVKHERSSSRTRHYSSEMWRPPGKARPGSAYLRISRTDVDFGGPSDDPAPALPDGSAGYLYRGEGLDTWAIQWEDVGDDGCHTEMQLVLGGAPSSTVRDMIIQVARSLSPVESGEEGEAPQTP